MLFYYAADQLINTFMPNSHANFTETKVKCEHMNTAPSTIGLNVM